jgi:hypothetical protein
MLPKNLKQPNSFHITKNIGGKFIGTIDIKCLNTWSNIALIIADSYSRASESRSHCIHWDHPSLPPSIVLILLFSLFSIADTDDSMNTPQWNNKTPFRLFKCWFKHPKIYSTQTVLLCHPYSDDEGNPIIIKSEKIL